MQRQCPAWTEVTQTRTKANRRSIVGGRCNFATPTNAVLIWIDSIVIVAGMHRRGRVDASVNPYPPNDGDGGTRTATSFVANFQRNEDAKDERPRIVNLRVFSNRKIGVRSSGTRVPLPLRRDNAGDCAIEGFDTLLMKHSKTRFKLCKVCNRKVLLNNREKHR